MLGQAGINYSTMLDRSVDFDAFEPIAKGAYLEPTERTSLQVLAQMLWDRAEGNGYASHMTKDPLPRTPRHTVLLFEAFGDHQVPNVATEVEARTIGARLRHPALAAGRSADVRPFWGIRRIRRYPYRRSALLVWDFGTPASPPSNVPPRGDAYGEDPHDLDVATPEALAVIAGFLAPDGSLGVICGGRPCDARPEAP